MKAFGTRTFHLYLKTLASLYLFGAILHLLDIFDFRLRYSELSTIWQVWIVYLLIFDFLASIGLWKAKAWGNAIFLLITISQLIAYLGFKGIFGDQSFLIIFHFATIAIFFSLYWWSRIEKTKLRRDS